MSKLLDRLTAAVVARSRHNEVALLLSGGIDSLSVGFALENAGKRIHAYAFCIEGYASKDLKRVRAIAARFGWPLTVITVPTNNASVDFVRLAVELRCRTKVQFEVAFPLAAVFPQIKEHEVWTGWNADRHYGNSRECVFRQRRLLAAGRSRAERKSAFDEERHAHFKGALGDPGSGLTWWYAQKLARRSGKTLFDPYVDDGVYDFFLQFDHEQLSPLRKPIVRQALAEQLARLPSRVIAVGVRLQSGAGASSLFSTLLQDASINRFDQRYWTVSGLCQRWGTEVEREPSRFAAELARLPHAAPARSVQLQPPIYRPYLTASAVAGGEHDHGAIELFCGGGGSGLGLHQAGFSVLVANEFVLEAARTYVANFPRVAIDIADIRSITTSRPEVDGFLRKGGLKRGQAALLSGSFPCCEFAHLGGGIGDQAQLRAYSTTRQRGISMLIFDFVAFARMALPKTVVSETVPPLATVYRPLLEGALDMLRFTASGRRMYFANYGVLSADDFGTPQARKRLFIIGVRSDVAAACGIESDADVLRVLPEPTHLPVSVRLALAGLHQSEHDILPWRTAMSTSGSLRHLVERLPKDPIDLVRLKHVGLSEPTSYFSLVRCSLDRPAPTLTIIGQQPNGLSGVIHPVQNRKLTLPELKRLTGLPDDFKLAGTLEQAVERVCRMVPPAMMRAVAVNIRERILRPYEEKR